MRIKPRTIKVVNAAQVGGCSLRLSFSDGKVEVVDFGPFLEKSRHPEIRKFLNPKYFKRFSIENGDLMWGDFDLIFPIMDLYENKLDHNEIAANQA